MDLLCEERPSDSPFVETVWRSRSEQGGPFISIAQTLWELVVTRYKGRTFLTVRGPETQPTPAQDLEGAEFFGVHFKPGVFMPKLPPQMVMDRRDLSLPEASTKSFWLDSSTWEYPEFENMDTFVDRLAREGLLVRDLIVEDVLQYRSVELSIRTVQRRFLQATGLSHNLLAQIERARCAVRLLKQGLSIPDVAYQAGYFDQPHLTRSLKHYIGLTPSQIADRARSERLSFLYKTDQPGPLMMEASDQIVEERRDEKTDRFRIPDPGRGLRRSWRR